MWHYDEPNCYIHLEFHSFCPSHTLRTSPYYFIHLECVCVCVRKCMCAYGVCVRAWKQIRLFILDSIPAKLTPLTGQSTWYYSVRCYHGDGIKEQWRSHSASGNYLVHCRNIGQCMRPYTNTQTLYTYIYIFIYTHICLFIYVTIPDTFPLYIV